MVPVTKAIVGILRADNQLETYTDKIYGPLVPQNTQMPYINSVVSSIEPYPTKSDVSQLDKYFIIVTCFSKNPEECFNMAAQVREALDRYPHGNHYGVNLQGIQFLTGVEDAISGDKLEAYTWSLEFSVRACK